MCMKAINLPTCAAVACMHQQTSPADPKPCVRSAHAAHLASSKILEVNAPAGDSVFLCAQEVNSPAG